MKTRLVVALLRSEPECPGLLKCPLASPLKWSNRPDSTAAPRPLRIAGANRNALAYRLPHTDGGSQSGHDFLCCTEIEVQSGKVGNRCASSVAKPFMTHVRRAPAIVAVILSYLKSSTSGVPSDSQIESLNENGSGLLRSLTNMYFERARNGLLGEQVGCFEERAYASGNLKVQKNSL